MCSSPEGYPIEDFRAARHLSCFVSGTNNITKMIAMINITEIIMIRVFLFIY